MEEAASPSAGNALRISAIIATITGAAGSILALLRESAGSSIVLTILFVGWILAPLIVLAWAILKSIRWPHAAQTLLYCAAFLIAAACFAYYYRILPLLTGSPRAFVFVTGPLACWVTGIVLAVILFPQVRRRK